MLKRGRTALTICSTAFVNLGRAQARALGHPHLPLAIMQHPFGVLTREEVTRVAEHCAEQIVELLASARTE